MNKYHLLGKQMNCLQYFLIFLLLGVLIGTVYANLFQTTYAKSFLLFQSDKLTSNLSEEVNTTSLFFTCAYKHLKDYALIWILAITILGRAYLFFIITYRGFLAGFLVSTFTMRFGIKGLLTFLSMLFPHYLILIPLFVFTYLKAYELNRRIYSTSGPYRSVILNEAVHYVPLVILILMFTILASLLEAFINSGIILKVMISLE